MQNTMWGEMAAGEKLKRKIKGGGSSVLNSPCNQHAGDTEKSVQLVGFEEGGDRLQQLLVSV